MEEHTCKSTVKVVDRRVSFSPLRSTLRTSAGPCCRPSIASSRATSGAPMLPFSTNPKRVLKDCKASSRTCSQPSELA